MEAGISAADPADGESQLATCVPSAVIRHGHPTLSSLDPHPLYPAPLA